MGRRSSSTERQPWALLDIRGEALQWGRRSSSTERPQDVRGERDRHAALQWGRRSSSTERRGTQCPAGVLHRALMGPSIFVDGETVTPMANNPEVYQLQWGRRSSSTERREQIRRHWRRRVASMGPSIFVDGERDPSELALGARVELQWGRRSSSTERTSTTMYRATIHLSFNGAVDLRRRRDPRG